MRFDDASLPAYAGTRAGHLLLRRLTGFGLKRPPYRAHTNLVFLGELGDCRPMSVTIGNDPLLTGIKSLGAPKFLALLPGSQKPQRHLTVESCRSRLQVTTATGRESPLRWSAPSSAAPLT
jgi:hypothetical protein